MPKLAGGDHAAAPQNLDMVDSQGRSALVEHLRKVMWKF